MGSSRAAERSLGDLLSDSGFTDDDLYHLVGGNIDWHRFKIRNLIAQKDYDTRINKNYNANYINIRKH